MNLITTDLIDLAAQFVNRTSQHIFLTGKAGTGKTTFLRTLANTTHKKFVVVAPTGIAALNAKGVTIHSQFLLPPGTFIPDRSPSSEFSQDQFVYTQSSLARKNPMNGIRRQVLRDIDLLIIDEVSMLRADLLDAIDYRMRSVKRNFKQSFGGVQVLMIGDLFQLPPVVRDNEWNYLRRYYSSAHFFEAKALQTDGFVYIELDKIFRQSDDRFIDLLNNLRNNCPTTEDISLLNSHFKTEAEIANLEDVVTLTTHNRKADELNQRALDQLTGKAQSFTARVEDEFPENMYPVISDIQLKIGAQIMFVKNDTQGGLYFNGKLARVVEMDSAEDEILVEMAGDKLRYTLKKEMWENKRYTVNAKTRELDEEVIGTFAQYPIKLAWAITVHKSQGLTFDKAVIDVGNAFAPGQVYVALSRLRSLDGLILRTRIDPGVIATDPQVLEFSSRKIESDELRKTLQSRQADFLQSTLTGAFDFNELTQEIDHLRKTHSGSQEFEEESMRSVIDNLFLQLSREKGNLEKFRQQLSYLLHTKDHDALLDRVRKGSAYYDGQLREVMRVLLHHIEEVRQLARTKTYTNDLAELDLLCTRKREEIGKSAYLAECILEGREIDKKKTTSMERTQERLNMLQQVKETVAANPKSTRTKTGRVKKSTLEKKTPLKKGSTYEETFALFRAGKNVSEIASQRSLAVSTIESHLAKGVEAGEIDIRKMVTDETFSEIENAFTSDPEQTLGGVYHKLKERFTFNQLRMVQVYLKKEG